MSGAQALLDAWEQVDHDGAPRSAAAAANFYLDFLPEIPGDNTPHIALWERDGTPDGILVGRLGVRRPVVRIGKWQFPMPRLRTLNITEGGLEARTTATAQRQAEYLRQLLEGGTIDCISVFRVPLDSEPGRILAQGLRKAGDGNPELIGHWYTELTDRQGCPVQPNSAKTRSAFRRKDRKLLQTFNGRVEVRELRSRDQLADFIRISARIGEASYQQGIGVGVQDNAWWARILGIHADNGSLRGYLLEADGENIAYLVGTLISGTFTLIATSFLPQYRAVGPGAFMLRRVIERLQQDGVRWLDYGVGDYSYKELHGTWRRENATLNLYGTSPAARLASILDTTGKKINRALYRVLKAGGMLERLKRLRRHLAERSGSSQPDQPPQQ
ncbi:GNAT family N-acetyltransferase [Microbulbifer guangxiensis]|uniref:GNAT family N-acetyltransferase n=1 Tax=Microbulbifer guangxiensis TaxID=2904249 RepID=UPI001F464B98|nr:GNAT family N-acetyltransferase [Microbulbifer guangxiensis]